FKPRYSAKASRLAREKPGLSLPHATSGTNSPYLPQGDGRAGITGRLASALGEWPWTDVFTSSETSNLLLSTLSASIVGVGDALGQFDRTNLLRVVRADGVIVKPEDRKSVV